MINSKKNLSIVGIYKIISPTGKIYVGQSVDINQRWKRYLRSNCKNQIKLYNSFKKYKPQNHQFEILEECHESKLNEREVFWGKYYDSLGENGLNLKLGNSPGSLSDISKKKISKSHLGKKKSKQHSSNISKARKGMIFSKSHKKNMSKSRFKHKVLCIENNKIYPSANQASKDLNIHPYGIIRVCKGEILKTKGYTFKFI
jgi:group I intron endonuclease